MRVKRIRKHRGRKRTTRSHRTGSKKPVVATKPSALRFTSICMDDDLERNRRCDDSRGLHRSAAAGARRGSGENCRGHAPRAVSCSDPAVEQQSPDRITLHCRGSDKNPRDRVDDAWRAACRNAGGHTPHRSARRIEPERERTASATISGCLESEPGDLSLDLTIQWSKRSNGEELGNRETSEENAPAQIELAVRRREMR